MKFLNYKDIKAKPAEEGASKLNVRWLITKEMGANNFAMRLFEMKPGGNSSLHQHPHEHEVYILGGEGIATDGEQERIFKPGDAIFIPPNERHSSWWNVHSEVTREYIPFIFFGCQVRAVYAFIHFSTFLGLLVG